MWEKSQKEDKYCEFVMLLNIRSKVVAWLFVEARVLFLGTN